MLSVIIPSYKDPLLHKTIDSLLKNAEGEIEIIPILDGYWPEKQIVDDERVKVLHLGKNRGMRGAINAGIDIAQGEYLMRTDEHCVFGKGFDVILARDCKPNWIVTPRRYYLDTVKWEIMEIEPVDYEKLKVRDMGNGLKKFEGRVWKSRARQRKDILVDETMAMQGSVWFMPKQWWEDVIVELDTKNYGTMYQDSHEMQFKTWKAGGKIMVNKNTWFAHKHVSFPRTHQHSKSDWEEGVRYAYNTWKDYYQEIRGKWGV